MKKIHKSLSESKKKCRAIFLMLYHQYNKNMNLEEKGRVSNG